jgi:hypothetical protein
MTTEDDITTDENVENPSPDADQLPAEIPAEIPAEPAPEPLPERLHHFRWDLDKTYIRTDFDTRRELVMTFLQSAEEKRGIPGAATLLRELLRPSEDPTEHRKVTFISGSPRQMRKVLTEKLRIDGIEPDQFILKPNLSNLLLFRFTAIRSQVGYKVEALLKSRLHGIQVEETLFGDDAEQDALVYGLYADLIAGRVQMDELEQILSQANADRREAKRIMELAALLEPDPATRVRRIFINLERRSPVSRFDAFGSAVCPIYNYFQAAFVLLIDDQLGPDSAARVLLDLLGEGYSTGRIANSLRNLIRRGIVTSEATGGALQRLLPALEKEAETKDVDLLSLLAILADVPDTRTLARPMSAEIDYPTACRDLRKYRRETIRFPILKLLE